MNEKCKKATKVSAKKAMTQVIKYKIYTREKEHNARHKAAAADATGGKKRG